MTQQLFDYLPAPVTQHVALALVHFFWQGTLVALLLAVVLRLLRDRAPSDRSSPVSTSTRADARYVIACVGLLVMAALPVVNLLVLEPPAGPAAGFDLPWEPTGGESPEASGQRAPTAGAELLSGESMITIEPPVGASIPEPAMVVAPDVGEPLVSSVERDAFRPRAWYLPPSARPLLLQWFFWIWLVGVGLLAGWHLLGWTLAHRLRRKGKNVPDEVITLAGRIARRLGIGRAVAVRQTLRASAPVVIGWIKPALVLPASVITGLAPHELEAVLAHELAHVRRHDYLVNLLQTVVETLLFYHPAVWWLSRRIRCEREFCADDLAMRACGGREVYVRSLIAVAESSRRVPSPAVAASGGSLLARVRRILYVGDGPSPSPRSARRSALAGVLAALCLGAGLMAAAQNRPADDTSAREEAVDSLPVADEREEIPGTDLRPLDSEQPPAVNELRPLDAERPPAVNELRPLDSEQPPAVNELRPLDAEQPPAASAEPVRFRIDRTQTTTPEWQEMIARCEDLPRIRAGHGQVTLMRVVLEEGGPDALIQMVGTKLVHPKDGSGGGRYLQIRNGDFALLDHINSARRREGKDPVEFGSFTHYPATIWVTVPARGTLGVLGDVVLSPVPEQEMGRIVATVNSADDRPLVTSQLRVGPLVVGGPYGMTFYFDSDRLAYTGRIAPGPYKILLPDFDMQKSRWTVDVSPGELTRLRFLARSQKDVEKIEEVRRPETELETRLFEARKPGDVNGSDASASPGVNDLDKEGFSPLHRAAIGGDVARVIELLKSGADVDVRQAKFQGTPLQYAAANGHAEAVRALLDRRAEIDACDTFRRTPLMWAAMKGETDVVRLLLDRGANVKARTETAWTPLHYAVNEGHAETAQLLIDRGADVAACNSLGKTPRELSGDLRLRWPEPPTPDERRLVAEVMRRRASRFREKLPEHVSTALPWLPADTELLIVANDFELPDPKGRGRLGPVFQAAGTLAVWPLPGPTFESLAGRRVRWAVHGGRNCEIVSAFGGVRQEGVSIIRFEQELPQQKLQELRNQLRNAAEEVRSLAGHDVYVFPPDPDAMEPSFKLKPWQGKYVVLADAETMITATSDAYLSELIARMADPPREVALPLSLPEWKYLDPDADVWLLRHLPDRNPNPRLRVAEGKRKLRGLVWMLRDGTKSTFRATYLPMPGWEKEVDELAHRWFIQPGETEIPQKLAALVEFIREPDGSVTLAIPGAGSAGAEFAPEQFLARELGPDDPRTRLFGFFTFGLHASQGIWH